MAKQNPSLSGHALLIEGGKGRPLLRCWTDPTNLGTMEGLPGAVWRRQPREISDVLVVTLGFGLAAGWAATLARLTEETVRVADIRIVARKVASEPTSMPVLDDGTHTKAGGQNDPFLGLSPACPGRAAASPDPGAG